MPAPKGGSIAGPQLLSLSLFVLLLAFFIVMTAVSSVDEQKSRPIIESLERTFASKAKGEQDFPAPQPGPDFGTGQGHAFDRIEALFMAQIPAFEAKRLDGNSTMFIRVSEQAFFEAVRPRGAESGSSFFVQTLLTILNPQQTRRRYELSLFINLTEPINDLIAERPEDAAFAVERAAQYGDILTQSGLPASLISVAVHTGETGTVDLYFRAGNEAPPDPFAEIAEEPKPLPEKIEKAQPGPDTPADQGVIFE